MKYFVKLLIAVSISSYSQTLGNGLTDIDGNIYNSVIIGTQEWQKENLNVSKYRDGTIIPQVTDPDAWFNLTTGAWCYYSNTTTNGTTYGKLYNSYAIAGIHDNDSNTPNKILAPIGWHLPTNEEWTTLISFLGGELVAGGKMKSTGTTLWIGLNTGATNQSGFTGLPGGHRTNFSGNGVFEDKGTTGHWWSSTWHTIGQTYWFYKLNKINTEASRQIKGLSGSASIRLIKDSSLSNTTFETKSLKIYPNPVISILNVKTDNNLINQAYHIIDSLGRVVLYGQLNEVDSTINVEQLSKGIYYLKVSNKIASKFIKD